MAKAEYLNIELKTRYYSIGNLNENTKIILFAFHGYGQLAAYFGKHFEKLGSEYFVVIPEGLHRFYIKGTEGRVGASWMTKEDRETDILNQSTYLNSLLNGINVSHHTNAKLCILGFSQGVATAMRWIIRNNIKIDAFINWAGSIPNDLPVVEVTKAFEELRMQIIIGDKDPYFNDKVHEHLLACINNYKLSVDFQNFDGEHKMEAELLKLILKKI